MFVTVNLCSCPFVFNDNSHMLYFNSKESRNNYFNKTIMRTLTLNIQYDNNLNEISVPYTLKQLTNINYLFFNDKFFFIDDINVVNDRVSKLILTMDVLQTYLYDCTFFPSFVDRCHVPRVQDNGLPTKEIESEGLAIGDYILKAKEEICLLTSSCVLATTTPLGVLDVETDFNPVDDVKEGEE